MGPGGTGPPNLVHPPIFRVIAVHMLLNTGQLDTVVLLVVASQMMRGQAPKSFFLEPPLASSENLSLLRDDHVNTELSDFNIVIP